MENKRVAVVRLHGKMGLKKDVKDTLLMLRLYKKHTCVVLPNTPVYIGMINKVKEFVTWGEIKPEVFKKLLEKRGRLPGKKVLTEDYLKQKLKLNFDQFTEKFFEFKKELKDVPGLKPFFKLSPPKHGYEKKGTKKPFSMGGALGYRKSKINELIERMI